jgi:predicted RNase H-like HicB family nuclease
MHASPPHTSGRESIPGKVIAVVQLSLKRVVSVNESPALDWASWRARAIVDSSHEASAAVNGNNRTRGRRFRGIVPELDIASEGVSIEEARTNLIEALALFFETASASEVSRRTHNEVFITQVGVPLLSL